MYKKYDDEKKQRKMKSIQPMISRMLKIQTRVQSHQTKKYDSSISIEMLGREGQLLENGPLPGQTRGLLGPMGCG